MADSRLNMQKDGVKLFCRVYCKCIKWFCKKRKSVILIKYLRQSLKSATANSLTSLTTQYLPVILSFNAV